MKQKHTDKESMVKGIKTLFLAMICMFIGPSLVYLILGNPDKPFFIPLIIIAALICVLAIFLAFKGLLTITKSMF